MKNPLFTISSILLIVFLGYLIANRNPPNMNTPKAKAGAENEVVLNKIKSEPKVKDAVITDSNILYVGVADDGTRRDGYAEYLCQVLKDINSDVYQVKVVRYGSHNSRDKDNAYGVLLGESRCR